VTLVNPGEYALAMGNEALEFNKIPLDEIRKSPNNEQFMDLFKKWMADHNIESILPLGHNWSYDRVVLRTLMGKDSEKYFFRRARDSHSLAVSINDWYEFNGKEKPFKETKLTSLAEYFGISSNGAHRGLKDCEMTAEVYRNLLKMMPCIQNH
jgi:DNA polymerase III epsilon subunit-like protein